MFYSSKTMKRIRILQALYLSSCFIVVFTFILILSGFAVAFN